MTEAEQNLATLEGEIAGTIAEVAALEKTTPVIPPFDERTLDFETDTDEEKGKHRERRSLYRFSDGTYSNGRRTIGELGQQKNGVSRELASIQTVQYWWTEVSWGQDAVLEILLDKPKEPRADGKKSDLSEHFQESFIDLIRTAPNNPMVRGHIMKTVKQMPPESLNTFDLLKDWIEKEFSATSPVKAAPQATAGRPAPSPFIEIEFSASETELGRASYRARQEGSISQQVTVRQLNEWIADGLDMDEILENIQEAARDNISMESVGAYEYDDWQSEDSTDFSITRTTDETAAIDAIRDLLHQHNPEALEQLDNG